MSSSESSTVIRISRLGWCWIGAALVAPWILVGWLLRPPPTLAGSSAARNTAGSIAPGPATQPTPGHAGPWGRLESSRILIEPPEDFVPSFYTTPQPLRWTFAGYTDAALAAVWQQAGLSPAQRQSLDHPSRRENSANGIILHPETELVLGLSPDARAKIYTALAVFPQNVPQFDPFRGGAGSSEDWFQDSTMPADVIALTKRLFYRRGEVILFSDHDLVLPLLADPVERAHYIKVLSRKSALLVKLHVRHDSDIDALASYWGQGRRSKDVKPLIQSLAQRPDGGVIDLVHLLPAFARALLYTYPLPSSRPSDVARDCHWTSLNFFHTHPDDRFKNLEFVQETIMNDYYPTSGTPAMGDIVMLLRSGGQGVHSCVYVADDIVFTKNGASFSTPWQLARLENVVAFYSLIEPLEVRRYRAREK